MTKFEMKLILSNLDETNAKIASLTGRSIHQLRWFLRKAGIKRNKEQLQHIHNRKGQEQRGENNPNWKGGISQYSYRYKQNQMQIHPERIRAREQVYKAKRKGILIPANTCSICAGSDKIEAHHPDYSEPLTVIWLCCTCHRNLHKSGENNVK